MRAPHLTGSRCLCRGCGCLFNSIKAFDRHRQGGHQGRRCLSPDGMRDVGMTLNAAGFWISRTMPNHRTRAVTRQIPAALEPNPIATQRGVP
jgi:hypothetical protein